MTNAERDREGLVSDPVCLHLHQTDIEADDPFAEPVWVCDDCGQVCESGVEP